MLKLLVTMAVIVSLAIVTYPAQPRAEEVNFAKLPDAGWQGYYGTGPLLVCWQAQRLIDALQPGVQGLPEHCTTLPPPVSFQVQSEPLWRAVMEDQGEPILVGVYAIRVVGHAGTLYTVLTARP